MIRATVLLLLVIVPALAQAPRGDQTGGDGDAPALQRAQEQALASAGRGGTVRVGPGLYSLGANVYTSGPVAWMFERGAQLAGPGQIDAVVDGAVLNASGLTLARLFAAPGNEHGLFVSARAAPSSGTAAYEKTGVISSLVQGDPSDYGRGVLRDLVGFESEGVIAPGTLTGRIWGYNSGVGPAAGADGYAVGGEFGVQSYSGSDAGPLGTPTSKIGVHAVAYGNSTSTAAFLTSGNGTTWQDGYVAQAGAISPGGHAVSVRPTGTTRAADVAWVATDGSLGLSRQMEIQAVGLGASRTRMLVAETHGAGRVELTDDGGAATAANTVAPGENTAVLIKRLRVLVFSPATGWSGTYGVEDAMVARGAGPALAIPAAPAPRLLSQVGAAPGRVSVGIGADEGRMVLTLTTDAASPLHAVAEVELLEVR